MKATSKRETTILHIDMDAFFVAVELLDKPHLRGKPVAVAHDGPRSVVTSASYEARRFGVRSAMPSSRAKNLCPNLIFLQPNMALYKKTSLDIMKIFEAVTPHVEQLSIDEAFLDVAGVRKLFGTPKEIAIMLRARLREECGLPASVGIASSKLVAKLASSRSKPDGLLIIEPDETVPFLHSLPISEMWGVGAATEKLLKARAIYTVADLANEPFHSLEQILGRASAKKLKDLSAGIDDREVTAEAKEKSIGHENTFTIDVIGKKEIEKELLNLSWRTASRLRNKNLEARTIAIKVRWNNFETVTRSRTLQEPTNSSERFYQVARELHDSLREWGRPIRLLGVRAEQLEQVGSSQVALWSDEESFKAVDHAVDKIRQRFGLSGLKPATLLDEDGK
ncbi:MAG TPA: DNA polymerase IV [Microbacteriaceae bacterium]|nr:DNA polymerase IV [Microbacteriaceae bacterium]